MGPFTRRVCYDNPEYRRRRPGICRNGQPSTETFQVRAQRPVGAIKEKLSTAVLSASFLHPGLTGIPGILAHRASSKA
jgi:hypothetical protein